jgi:Flp pilus assembly protein TadG
MERMNDVRRERGQATVEFALIIPILVLVIVGLIEFGRAFNYWISLSHLANEGARYAAVDRVPTPSGGTFEQQLAAYLKGQALTKELQTQLTPPKGSITVCYVPATDLTPASPNQPPPRAGDAVTVTLQADHTIGLVFMPKIPVTLKGKSTMRLEQTPADPAGWTKCA